MDEIGSPNGTRAVITGRKDIYFTVLEFASMIGREEKTVRNWAAEGRLQFVHLCGVPLVPLSIIENLIGNVVPPTAADGMTAAKLMNRVDRRGRRTKPEKHRCSDASGIADGR